MTRICFSKQKKHNLKLNKVSSFALGRRVNLLNMFSNIYLIYSLTMCLNAFHSLSNISNLKLKKSQPSWKSISALIFSKSCFPYNVGAQGPEPLSKNSSKWWLKDNPKNWLHSCRKQETAKNRNIFWLIYSARNCNVNSVLEIYWTVK